MVENFFLGLIMGTYIYSFLKPYEAARLSGKSIDHVKNYFKDNNKIKKINSKIIEINPESAEDYFKSAGLDSIYKPSISLFANLCGGVGKTSGVSNVSAAVRRIVGRDTPVILIDGDSQASLTNVIFGREADEDQDILLDFFEKRSVKIDDILTEINDNVWVIKSNLNQIWIDKCLVKPKHIKKGMLTLYEDIFKKFEGKNVKIFQDHTPQLSNLFASSVSALYSLPSGINKSVLIPMRSDNVAINGANYIIKEIRDLCDTFNHSYEDVNICCYFSNIDKRVKTTKIAIESLKEKGDVYRHVISPMIRTCSKVTQSTMSQNNVYSTKYKSSDTRKML